jgi:hypothetical protein
MRLDWTHVRSTDADLLGWGKALEDGAINRGRPLHDGTRVRLARGHLFLRDKRITDGGLRAHLSLHSYITRASPLTVFIIKVIKRLSWSTMTVPPPEKRRIRGIASLYRSDDGPS